MVERICYKGAKAICEAVGENPKEIVKLVDEHELPAWKRDGRGAWRALPEDLELWIKRQRDQSYQKRKRGVGAIEPAAWKR